MDAVSNGDLSIIVSNSRSLTIMDIDATEHGGEYECIVINDAGVGRAAAILYVEPYFTLQPVDVFANHGETATFTCKAESFPHPSYQWQKWQGSMFMDIANETDMTLTINDGSYGEYRCMVMSVILGKLHIINSGQVTLHGKSTHCNDLKYLQWLSSQTPSVGPTNLPLTIFMVCTVFGNIKWHSCILTICMQIVLNFIFLSSNL